jgi:DNA helicase HerA-like ATPase
MKIGRASTSPPRTRRVPGAGEASPLAGLPADAFDDRIAIVGTAGSGKTYAAKGFVERLLESGARVAIVDPLGVWWGLRASADGSAPGYPVIVFGGKHADVPINSDMGVALGRILAREALVCVVDLSDLGSNAARRRFMATFAEALYETNEEPLHLVLDEADLWAPQRPIKGWEGLLGHIEEIVRRGRVRGFIPWLITQRPAVVHKDVLSQADILIAMKLTASQDRDAIGAWIEGQATGRKASGSSAICRGCNSVKAICGLPATAYSSGSPFRQSGPSTARARPNAANASRYRARWQRWTSPR